MARQRRTFDEQLADMATRSRTARTVVMTTPAMAAVTPDMISNDAILNEHLADGAVSLDKLDETIQDTLTLLAENDDALAGAAGRLAAAEDRLDDLFTEVGALPASVEAAKQEAITAAQAYTDAQEGGGGVSPEELEALRVDAQAKADAAQAAAEAFAITKMNEVANSKNATFYGTATPAPTAPAGTLTGDTYRRRNAAGNIIGEWEWSATAKTWTQRKMTSESMTAVDVGVLTAGSAVIQDAVVQKIAAGTAAIQKADIGNLTVTGTTNLADAVARRIAANTASFIELSTDNLVAGSAVIDQGVVNKLYADVVQSRQIEGSQIKAGTITANHLQVTGSNMVPDPNFLDSTQNAARIKGATNAPAGTISFLVDNVSKSNAASFTGNGTAYVGMPASGDVAGSRIPVTTGDVVRLTVRYRVLGTAVTGATSSQIRFALYHDGADTGYIRYVGAGDYETISSASTTWQEHSFDYTVTQDDVAFVRPVIQFRNPGFSGAIQIKWPSVQVAPTLRVRSTVLDGVMLETKLGITEAGLDAETFSAPGIEFNRLFETQTTPIGYRPARIFSTYGNDVVIASGKAGGASQRPPGESWLRLENGNVVAQSENDDTGGKGLHSHGAVTVGYNGRPKRLPLGILDMWSHTTAMTITGAGVTITQKTIFVPAFATIKVTVALNGYSMTANMFAEIKLFVDGVGSGRHVHDTGPAGSSSDIHSVHYFTSPYANPRNCVFRVVGTSAYPTTATFNIVAKETAHGASSHVTFEDIGSVYNANDPVPNRLN